MSMSILKLRFGNTTPNIFILWFSFRFSGPFVAGDKITTGDEVLLCVSAHLLILPSPAALPLRLPTLSIDDPPPVTLSLRSDRRQASTDHRLSPSPGFQLPPSPLI
nr:hypothetical protein Iba_chr05eCG1000 [Ipomoea batatas]